MLDISQGDKTHYSSLSLTYSLSYCCRSGNALESVFNWRVGVVSHKTTLKVSDTVSTDSMLAIQNLGK